MTQYHGFTGPKRQRCNMWIWAEFPVISECNIEPEFDDYSKFDPPTCVKPAIEQDEYAFIIVSLQRYHDRDYGE